MTNREAIVGEIEPFTLSDDSVEKAFVDASGRLSSDADVDDDYKYNMKSVVGLAAMLCLNRLRVLASENVGGISQSYNVEKLDKRIRAIAKDCGLSADLVLADDGDDVVTYMPIW